MHGLGTGSSLRNLWSGDSRIEVKSLSVNSCRRSDSTLRCTAARVPRKEKREKSCALLAFELIQDRKKDKQASYRERLGRHTQ